MIVVIWCLNADIDVCCSSGIRHQNSSKSKDQCGIENRYLSNWINENTISYTFKHKCSITENGYWWGKRAETKGFIEIDIDIVCWDQWSCNCQWKCNILQFLNLSLANRYRFKDIGLNPSNWYRAGINISDLIIGIDADEIILWFGWRRHEHCYCKWVGVLHFIGIYSGVDL